MLKLFRIILATVLVVIGTPLALWIAGYGIFGVAVLTMKEPVDTIRADAAIVLTGGTGRVNRGLDLLATKRIRALLISGVHKDVKKSDLLRQWQKSSTEKKTVPDCCLTLGYEADNTVGNATESQRWLKKNKAQIVFVVTANYHMPRSLLELNHAAPHVNFIPYPVKSDKLENDKDAFWNLIFLEYNKLLVSLIRVIVFPTEISPVPQALAS